MLPTPPNSLPPLPRPPGLPEVAAVFRVLGDPTRLKIVKLLAMEEFCVCEMVHLLGLSQPAVSQHLAKLRSAGLVRERRAGQWIFYRLDRERLEGDLAGFARFLDVSLGETPGLEAEAALRRTLDRVAVCRIREE